MLVDHQKGRRQNLTRWSVVILKQLGQIITNGTNRKPLEIYRLNMSRLPEPRKKTKNSDFFHGTGCLMGIFIMVY